MVQIYTVHIQCVYQLQAGIINVKYVCRWFIGSGIYMYMYNNLLLRLCLLSIQTNTHNIYVYSLYMSNLRVGACACMQM